MPLLLGYWMMQLQLTGRQGACSKLEPGGRFVVVMDTVVGLGRHKWFPLTQNPLTGAGFLSRASRGSVVTLAVVFRFFSKARVDISGTGIPKLDLFFTASCLVLAWSLHCFPKTPSDHLLETSGSLEVHSHRSAKHAPLLV